MLLKDILVGLKEARDLSNKNAQIMLIPWKLWIIGTYVVNIVKKNKDCLLDWKKKTREIGVKLENRMMVNYTVDCQHSVGSVVQSGVWVVRRDLIGRDDVLLDGGRGGPGCCGLWVPLPLLVINSSMDYGLTVSFSN